MFLGTYLHPSRHVLSIEQKAKIVIFRAIYLLTLCPLTVRNVKKSPGQETGLGNRGRLKVVNDTKFVFNEHELDFFLAFLTARMM